MSEKKFKAALKDTEFSVSFRAVLLQSGRFAGENSIIKYWHRFKKIVSIHCVRGVLI